MNWLLSRTKGDFVIWGIVFTLSLFGVLAVYSSTGTLAYKRYSGNTELLLAKHMFLLLMGIGFMYLAHRVDYRYYYGIARVLLILSFPLLAYTLFFGSDINDAKRWISIPIINATFQTSDLAKVALIMYVARMLSKKQEDIKDFKKAFLPILSAVVGVCLLIAPANLSTSLVLFSTCLIVMFIGRINFKYLLLLVASGVVGLGLLIGILFNIPDATLAKIGRFKTWKSRIETFTGDKDGNTYQSDQAKIAIATGGLFGKGPGNSTQRNFLPHPYSDFIFAVIVEEYGMMGGLFLICLYLLFLWRTVRIVVRSPKAFGALLAFGLSLSLVIQAFINMAVAVNIFPVTGLPLPLVSMGGTSLWFTSFAFGVILSVSRFIDTSGEMGAGNTETNSGNNTTNEEVAHA
ncbi:MAG TPA: putative peptidoglycan glycosyltransferase FtsW [Bacteroidia bacterium]|jgi:cell division protein FtsW|nr:cell division protein FtsW [Bacteroidia bacterium]MBP7260585.1 cell division protein FtsW [Bacteroidia bacterium]MBP9179845.1 cell division protein FtsW [Bacteroidia bacterium]MBP9724207.1 cell division protein FtsW [Bacteroidia bacterium]HLP32489.1 putative peptidoglycan glycosyltransferase FtsW [Bacteroidia bacterium]